MPTGRPPKPEGLHILEGTFRKDRHGEPEQAADLGRPACPGHLRGEALTFWKQIVPGLVERRVAGAADAPALAQLCEWWATCRRLQKFLNRIPDTDKRLFRIVANLATATDKFQAIASRFGLTPSDRARLKMGGEKKAGGVMSRQRPAGGA